MVDIVKIQIKDFLSLSLIHLKEETTIILFQKFSIVRRRYDFLNKLSCCDIFKFLLILGKNNVIFDTQTIDKQEISETRESCLLIQCYLTLKSNNLVKGGWYALSKYMVRYGKECSMPIFNKIKSIHNTI